MVILEKDALPLLKAFEPVVDGVRANWVQAQNFAQKLPRGAPATQTEELLVVTINESLDRLESCRAAFDVFDADYFKSSGPEDTSAKIEKIEQACRLMSQKHMHVSDKLLTPLVEAKGDTSYTARKIDEFSEILSQMGPLRLAQVKGIQSAYEGGTLLKL